MKDLVLAGIQWSGKWTQCEFLIEKFGEKLNYFEAGGILRALQSRPNVIGKYIASIIDNGNLMPDEFMIKIFDLFLYSSGTEKSLLIDWFPRQIIQMEAFLEIMKNYKRDFVTVILEISEVEAIKRLLSRRICRTCWAILNTELHDCNQCYVCKSTDIYQREDDKDIKSIETRLKLFEEKTGPVIRHLEKEWFVKRVNWMQDPQKVFEEIEKIIS